MNPWSSMANAPKDRPFLARQDGEIYVAKYTDEKTPRLRFRKHGRRVESIYKIIRVVDDGKKVEAQIPINQPWNEYFEHRWIMWTRGFEFAPTEWAEIPGIGISEEMGDDDGK